MKVVRIPRFFVMVIVLVMTSARMFAATAQPTAAETSGIAEGASAEVKGEKASEIDGFSELTKDFALPEFKEGRAEKGAQYNVVASKFGNKTVNLCLLTVLAETVNKEVLQDSGYTMAVPALTAISHDVIAAYLDQVMGLSQLWGAFQKEQGDNRNLQEKAAAVLAEIQTGIRKAFSDKAPEHIQRLFEPFLKQNAGSLLMVRSTSLEDRVDMANAGGNESKSSVQLEPVAVWHAIGEVVESYFSEKSIKQRLLAGDDVTTRYFIPVLLQCMIGENAWHGENPATLEAIPVSGVMFTEFAEAKGSHVVQIQSAYGHNQGVVNSLVAVDTFYLGPSGVIYPVIRKKEQRLVTVGTELQAKDNYLFDATTAKKDYAMQTASSLTPAIIRVLKQIADRVHQIYDHAMDIEFVVQGKVIYLVQARPLIHRVETKAPSYLRDALVGSIYGEKEVKAAATGKEAVEGKEAKVSNLAEASTAAVVTKAATVFTGSSVGVAGGYVRVINSPAQVIIRDDIGQALDAYHANAQRDKVLVILIKKTAPSTSHEATQFRSYGKPVMVFAADRLQAIEQILNNLEGKSLLVDPQRGMAALVPGALEEKTAAPFIVPGWYTHPIPLMVSVVQGFYLSPTSALGEGIKTYIETLMWDSSKDEDDGKVPMRQLLAVVKGCTVRDTLIENLKLIIHRLGALALPREITTFKSLRLEALQLAGAATVFASDVLYTFDQLKTSEANESEKRLAFLYPIKFLEALVLQQPDSDVVDGFSYASLIKGAIADREKLVGLLQLQGEALKKADPKMVEYAVQCMKVQTIALNDMVRSQWELFVNGLVRSLLAVNDQDRPVYEKAIKQLATMIGQFNNLGILEAWVHTSFVDAWEKSRKAKAHALVCIKRLMDETEGTPEVKTEKEAKEGKEAKEEKKEATSGTRLSNKEVIEWVSKQSQMLAACERRINEWESPEQFNTLLKQFYIVHDLCISRDEGAEKAFKEMMFDGGNETAIRGGYKMGIQTPWEAAKTYAERYSHLVYMFKHTGRLGKLSLVSFLKRTVDVFDRTIKAMTGSVLYQDKNVLARNFSTILPYYLSLMEQLMVLLPSSEEPHLMRRGTFFEGYVGFIRSSFQMCYESAQEMKGATQLYATKDFSAENAQIGSQALYLRCRPQSLEDCFTLMHQNMLAVIAVLNRLQGFSAEQLPLLVKTIGTQIINTSGVIAKKMGANERFVNIVGIDYTYPYLTVTYNLPLGYHSAMFKVVWNKKYADRAILTSTFIGHNEANRMHGLCGYANIASVALGVAFDQIPHTTAPLDEDSRSDGSKAFQTNFSWVITKDTDLSVLGNCLACIAYSMEAGVGVVGTMIVDMHSITHKFFQGANASAAEKAASEFEKASGKERMAFALDIYNALPALPDAFFTNTLFCNDWFIEVYMAAEKYAQALHVIQLTLGVMVAQQVFGYLRHRGTPLGLLDFCVGTLGELVQKNKIQPEAVSDIVKRLQAEKDKGTLNTATKRLLASAIKQLSAALKSTKVAQKP